MRNTNRIRRRKRKSQLSLEALERRNLLAAVSISGVTLTYLADPGEVNDLVVTEVGGIITLSDQGAAITAASPGITQNGPNDVSVPAAGLDILNVVLGDQNDSLDASDIAPSSGLRRLFINDGDGDDTLVGSDVDDIFTDGVGNDSIDGRAAISRNQLTVNRDSNVVMDNSTFTVGTEVNSYVDITFVHLQGGAGDNLLDASAVTSATTINSMEFNGRAGNDTMIGGDTRNIFRDSEGNNVFQGSASNNDWLLIKNDTGMVLTDTQLVVGTGVSVISGIENISLEGGAGDNVIDTSGTTLTSGITRLHITTGDGNDTVIGGPLNERVRDTGGSNIMDGGGGADELYLEADQNITVTDTTLAFGNDQGTVANFERLFLTGGASDNVLDASGVTTGYQLVHFSGGAGNDTLLGSQLTDQFRDVSGSNFIDGNGNGALTSQRDHMIVFGNIDMQFSDAATSGFGTAIIGASTNTFTEVESIRVSAGSADNVLDASGLTATSGVKRAVVDAGAGDDTLLVSEDPAIEFFVFGQQGFDTLDLRHFTSTPSITSQPGSIDGLQGDVNGAIRFDNIDEILVTVINTAPQLSNIETDATLASKARIGDTVTLTGTFTDPDANDSFTAQVDWGDGTASTANIDAQAGTLDATHVYQSGGIFEVTVTFSDGTETVTEVTSAIVTGTRVTPDGELQIVGTNGRDMVHIHRSGENLDVVVKSEGTPAQHFQFPNATVQSIRVITCEGSDHIYAARHISQPMDVDSGNGDDFVSTGSGDDYIRAGAGHDQVSAGSGNDIVLGGEGHDQIFGGDGRDLLIGGSDQDMIFGGFGEDILIGGDVLFADSKAALFAIRNEWTANKSFSVRQQNLQDGGGDGNGANGSYFLDQTTLLDDEVSDQLFGGHELDWEL